MTVITRFPPSPTGDLHVGSARTALYSWLYAKHTGGKMVLRIEDTDVQRSTEESVKAIFDGLEWLGLTWDEGPFYQTKRLERYKEVVEKLLSEGKAYKCYCSKERLDNLREQQLKNKEKPRYDGLCRKRSDNEDDEGKYVIRFKNIPDGDVVFKDIVRGNLSVSNSELDDLILVRSDGMPTYNMTVVVDDMDMNISHVIRGEDHISNTFRQINILQALGAKIPTYAHISMIHGEDGQKLSKRHGAVGVMSYRDAGFLPEALLNYLIRLGWSFKDKEIFSREEMIELFSLDNLQKSPAVFNQEKLLWLNQHYMKELPERYVARHLKWHFDQQGVNSDDGPALEEIVKVQSSRVNNLVDMVKESLFFYSDDIDVDQQAKDKHLTAEALPGLQLVLKRLEAISEWSTESIKETIKDVTKELGVKLGKLAQPLRVAVTGNTSSPSIDVTIMLVGKDRVLKRLSKSINIMNMGLDTAS